jgi:hypothetical protein
MLGESMKLTISPHKNVKGFQTPAIRAVMGCHQAIAPYKKTTSYFAKFPSSHSLPIR